MDGTDQPNSKATKRGDPKGKQRKQRSEGRRFVLFLVVLVVAVSLAALLGYWVPRGVHRILEFRGA